MASEKREIEIALKSKGAESSADRLNGKVKQVGASADKAESSVFKLTKVAGALGVALAGAGVASFFTKANQAAIKFNESISNLSAITGAVGNDLKFLSDTALEFGATTTLSATEAAEALKLVASAKPDLLSNAAALKEVTKQAVLLAEASGGTLALADAAGAVGKALNQFGEEADQAARFVNVLAAGSKFGSSEVLATSQALKEAGVSAASAKVSFEQTNAAIQILAKTGIDGSQAGTALRNIFLKLDTDLNKNLRPSVVGLSQALENVNKLNEDGAAQVKRWGLENITAAKSLLSNVDLLADLEGKLTGTNTAFQQASTNVDNLSGDVKALSSAYESLQIRVGSLADGELRQLTQATTEFIQALNGNEDALNNWSDTLTTIESTAIAVAAVVAGRLVSSLSASVVATVKDIAAKEAQIKANVQLLNSQRLLAASQLNAATQDRSAAQRHLANATNATVRASAITKLAAANARATASQTAMTAATNAYTGAAARATLGSRALTGAMAFIGGPVGVAVVAAAALIYFIEEAETAAERSNRLAQEVDTLKDSFTGLTDAQRQMELNKISVEYNQLQTELQKANEKLNTFKGFTDSPIKTAEVAKYEGVIDNLNKKLDELNVKQQALVVGGLPSESEFTAAPTSSQVDDTNSGLDNLLSQDGIFSGSSESGENQTGGPSGAGLSFIDRLKLETEQLQAELEVRRQLNAGYITEQQANDAIGLQNLLFNYETKRQTILEQEFQTETLRQEALAALREQELESIRLFEANKTEIKQEGDDERLAMEEAYNDQVKSLQLSTLSNAVGLLADLTGAQKAAAIAGIAIQTATAFSANQAATAAAATLAFASQVVPGDISSLGRAYAAEAAALALGNANGALILASGALKAGGALSGGGSSSGGGGSSSAPPASTPVAASPSVENQSQNRVINITGLDGFDDDQPIPLTVGGLKSLLSSNEDVNIAINQGQQNATRLGAI